MPVWGETIGFASVVDAAARQLVSVDHRTDGAFISLPMLYPSGSNVIVRIEPSGRDEFLVSDYGQGFIECDLMGATHQFRRHAPQIAENSGIKFDGDAFFVVKVTEGQIAGAAATVANCSLEAVSLAALKLSEKKFHDDSELLHERLVSVFTAAFVAKDVDVLGASQTPWHVSNVVRLSNEYNRVTIFEPVTKHHASVAAAATKFHDIALLDKPPGRVAVVRKKTDFGTYLSVLAQSADVITRDVPDSTLRRLAEAA